jgi:hypothetical protein
MNNKQMKLTHVNPVVEDEWFEPTNETPMGLRYVDRDGDLVAITFNRGRLITSFADCTGPATHRMSTYTGQIREIREGETFTIARR